MFIYLYKFKGYKNFANDPSYEFRNINALTSVSNVATIILSEIAIEEI